MATVSYEVELGRDESGAWIAQVPAVPGCHTYGRSLRQAKNRIREALSLWVDDAEEAELKFRHTLPPEAKFELQKVRIARRRAAAILDESRLATSRAVRYFHDEVGLSVRDIADLTELSHQRVQQLLDEQPDEESKVLDERVEERAVAIRRVCGFLDATEDVHELPNAIFRLWGSAVGSQLHQPAPVASSELLLEAACLVGEEHAVRAGTAEPHFGFWPITPTLRQSVVDVLRPTPKEGLVLRMVAGGIPLAHVAARLKLREGTVKRHVETLYAKLARAVELVDAEQPIRTLSGLLSEGKPES